MKIEEITDKQQWDELVEQYDGHPLQLWGWGELKSRHNWSALRLSVSDQAGVVGGAQVLLRRLPWPFRSVAYVPRGPFAAAKDWSAVADQIADYLKGRGCVYLSIEPDLEEVELGKQWRQSKNNILLSRTLILDLTKDQEQLAGDISSKTRHHIRKAERDCDEIRRLSDREVDKVLNTYRQTAKRAGFKLHSDDYYHDCSQQLGDNSVIFGAFKEDKLVSFVWLALNRSSAFELYGGMNEQGQKLRANYALKWYAITESKKLGALRYDLNGLLNDGISDFKRRFGKDETQLAGTYEYVYKPFLHWVWFKLLPIAKKLLRLIKK